MNEDMQKAIETMAGGVAIALAMLAFTIIYFSM